MCWLLVFDTSDENMLVLTEIHKEYSSLVSEFNCFILIVYSWHPSYSFTVLMYGLNKQNLIVLCAGGRVIDKLFKRCWYH